MNAPRTGAETLAEWLGVSVGQARAIRKRFTEQMNMMFEEMDGRLRAQSALADLDAAQSIDQDDVEFCAASDDPIEALKDTLAERSEQSLRARLAAHSSWAKTEDRAERTRPAREALERKFEDEVDPDRVLDPRERAIRVEHARKAHYLRLALKSAEARRLRKKKDGETPQQG